MKSSNPFVAFFSLAVVFMATQIGGSLSMQYDVEMTSLGFADVTINRTIYKNLEVVVNHTGGKSSESCRDGFVPAHPSIMNAFPDIFQDLKCRIGVDHEANENEPELTQEQANNETFVKEKIKELDFHWNLDGKRLETFHADPFSVGLGNIQALKLAYYFVLFHDHLRAVEDDYSIYSVCCMRHPYLPAPRTPSYPKWPEFGMGRHDVTINGHEYKNVPYVYAAKEFCPDGMKKAIVTDKESFIFPMMFLGFWCSLSADFVGSPTPLFGEDPNDLKVKRSRFLWIFDGKHAGVIPDELWDEGEPEESLENLQNMSVWINLKSGIIAASEYNNYACCMDLKQADTTTTTTESETTTTTNESQITTTTNEAEPTTTINEAETTTTTNVAEPTTTTNEAEPTTTAIEAVTVTTTNEADTTTYKSTTPNSAVFVFDFSVILFSLVATAPF